MPEKEYIEKDKALNAIECIDISNCTDIDDVITEAERAVDDLPTADVSEVKHGEWIKLQNSWECRCSLCGAPAMYHIDSTPSNYCPSCGADMRGKND